MNVNLSNLPEAQASSHAAPSKLSSIAIKSAIAACIFFIGAGLSAPAEAGRHYGDRYYGGHYYHDYRPYRRYCHHRRHRHHSRRGAYLAGGLLLGSIITHAYHRANHPHYNERVRERRVVRSEPHEVTRRLFRDRNGNCFERTQNSRGAQVLIELDPGECAW